MNNQLQTAPVAFDPYGEGLQDGQGVKPPTDPRQDLAARVCAAEMALHRAQSQIDRRDKIIDALKEQLGSMSNGQGAPGEPSTVHQMAQARCAELEQEVATLRQALEGLNATVAQQQGPTQAEIDLRNQLEAANAFGQQNSAACEQAQTRCAQLEMELDAQSQAREELTGKLALEQKLSADAAVRIKQLEAQTSTAQAGVGDGPASDLELQVRQGVAALARATAELAQERGQRQRSEQRAAELNNRLQALHQDLGRALQAQHADLARITSMEEQQRQAVQALEQRTADLEQQAAEHRLAEEQLQKANELNAQLHKDVAFLEEANKKFEGSRQDLQTRLEASINSAREAEARLQQEKGERQRLSEALDSVTRKAGDRSERDLEFSKLQSALQSEQVECQRKENQLAHVRHNAQDAAHAARAVRTSLRRQVREPVDDVVNRTRSLLELELGDEQKKLAQAMLEDVLLVQTRLREPEAASGESAEGSAPARSDS